MYLAQFLAGRLVKGIIVLFAIAILNFLLIRAAPGDPAQVLAGEAGAADAHRVSAMVLNRNARRVYRLGPASGG
jgi:ABC-type dipeptide/oligopeptide/nickel transport system permease component